MRPPAVSMEFERFYVGPENRHQMNDAAIAALLHPLLAPLMEVRAGELSRVGRQCPRPAKLVRAERKFFGHPEP